MHLCRSAVACLQVLFASCMLLKNGVSPTPTETQSETINSVLAIDFATLCLVYPCCQACCVRALCGWSTPLRE